VLSAGIAKTIRWAEPAVVVAVRAGLDLQMVEVGSPRFEDLLENPYERTLPFLNHRLGDEVG
jgi:hypothetical protein